MYYDIKKSTMLLDQIRESKYNKYQILLFFSISLILFVFYLPSKLEDKKNINLKRYLNSEFIILDNLLKEGKIDTALDKALNLYFKYPDQADIICSFLGDIYNIINDLKKSEWYYREAIKINSNEVIYYIKLSKFYRFRKQLQSSYKVLTACLNIAPLNPLLHIELGDYYYDNNDVYNAIKYWEKVYNYSHYNDINMLLKIGSALYKINDKTYKKYFDKYIRKGGAQINIDRIINE